MRGGPTVERAAFHTVIEQDDISDAIASATVLAPLRSLEMIAELLEWPYDSDKLNRLVERARRLNESAIGNPVSEA